MDCLPRYATPRTPSRKTHGGRLAAVGEAVGTPFMPWQRQVADVVGEVNPATGRLAYREVRLTVPRQSGKTSLILPVLIYRCLGPFGQRQRVVYTAQDRNKARKKFMQEHVDMLQRSPLAGMFTPNMSHGEERITWSATGSIHGIDASGETSGHGDVLDVGVIDEAFARTDDRVEQAMIPAMSTRDSAQLWVVSTAGTRTSTYLRGKVDDGRARVDAGQNSGIAYFEWAAGDDVDVNDPELWPSYMPALGHTISTETVMAARDSMAARPGAFARAYGNVWDDKRSVEQIIPAEAWDACADTEAVVPGRVVWAIETAEDGSWSAIAAAGYTGDGRELVELIEYRPGERWMLPRLIEVAGNAGCWDVALDAAGPAAAMIPDLRDAGFTVLDIQQREKARACVSFLSAAISTDDGGNPDRLVHRRQIGLDDAITVADKAKLGDLWVWSRGASLGDISPLFAVTLARWALSLIGPTWRSALGSIG